MPGPISDSYDPEFSTGHNCQMIRVALDGVYARLSEILGNQKPLYILHLVDADLPKKIEAQMSEKEWRLLRFAVERAKDSI